MRYFNLLFFLCFYLIGFSQPSGFEGYIAIKKCDSLEFGVKTMRPEVNSDSLTTRTVFSFNYALSADGIDNVVNELERILELHGLASDARWSLTYSIDNSDVRLRCEEYLLVDIYIGNN